MKKSKIIHLVLITAALASCHKKKVEEWSGPDTYMRSDTTAVYQQVHSHSNGWMWYYCFRPYGTYYGGKYNHAGYYCGAISEHANIGNSAFKSTICRGGFGHGEVAVSS